MQCEGNLAYRTSPYYNVRCMLTCASDLAAQYLKAHRGLTMLNERVLQIHEYYEIGCNTQPVN